MNEKKEIYKILFTKIAGLVIFLILLGIANYFSNNFDNKIYDFIVDFFNENLSLVFALTFLYMASEMLWCLKFPFILLAPLFSGFAGLGLMSLIFKMILFSQEKIDFNFRLMKYYKIGLYLIFILTIIIGYILILFKVGKKENEFSWNEIKNEIKKSIDERIKDVKGNKTKKK